MPTIAIIGAGRGLGLAIVERLVRRAGGEWQIGNHDGRGLRVLMSFPFAAVPQARAASETVW